MQKSGVAVIVGRGEGVIEGVGEGVIEGKGVKLGTLVIAKVGTGGIFPHAPTRINTGIIKCIVHTQRRSVINKSILNPKIKYNCRISYLDSILG
jgi:hypothetical protein